jgi:hypothetical protein
LRVQVPSFSLFEEMVRGARPRAGNYSELNCKIPDGFTVCYSIEEQPQGGWYRHLSVAVDHPEKLPNPPAVSLLLEELGYKDTDLEKFSPHIHVWIEHVPGGGRAINVLERILD